MGDCPLGVEGDDEEQGHAGTVISGGCASPPGTGAARGRASLMPYL